ncbi:signal recognition particle-docking protein FtsY [Erwinia sp. MMLR14_017]|uniref:signal recognition particle-docking protein FtsY n=1 Tax=Erwinia sp. MMLR14_017 TaxID=3093842 RepID=UPI00298F8A0E|nr:signal recognition particle-docking protein FtsY [Erwinia sp. MMLR14_017]MDW8845256.1 signal recognition particle-docking protein FtsY [Erwinia sp. MMLR14_017]
MAKNKKRGFFSWLGLGREEQAPQEEIKETSEEQHPAAETSSDEATPAAEQRAEAIVEVTETVAQQQAAHAEEALKARPAEETLPEEVAEVKPAPEEEYLPEEVAEVKPAPEEEYLPEEVAEVKPAPEEEYLPEEVAEVKPAPEEEYLPEEAAEVEPEEEISPEELEALALAADDSESGQINEEESVAAALAKVEQADSSEQAEQQRPTKEGFFARLKRSLVKTRQNLGSGFIGLFRGKKIDDDLFEELEEQLLIADVGVETTRRIISNLTQQANRKQLRDAEALYGLLKQEMSEILAKVEAPLDVSRKTPFVILMVGVNGVGKTTTIGKLARQYQAEGKSVMLAAGDTFRAAAVEQLQVWGQRNNIPVIAQQTGADSASVIFDAIQAAKARHVDVLIADTAGRLQNKAHLMEELKKITRVMKKLDEQAPHEVMLTIDASTGQNAISQTKLFHEAVGLTGITLTKLDGTAKGGVIFSVADQFAIPIRYIGVGEGIEDLRSFKADDFIEALFARED